MTSTAQNNRKRSFLDSYKTADVAEKCLREQFKKTPLTLQSHGIDMRHQGLSSDEIDGRPDFKLHSSDGERLSYLELKSKRSASWMMVCNQYAFDRYVSHAQTHPEPTWIGWVLLEDDGVVEQKYVEVQDWDQVKNTWTAPDGHTVVRIDDSDAVSFETFVSELQQ